MLKKSPYAYNIGENTQDTPYGSVKTLFKLNFSEGSLKRVLKPNKANVMGDTPNSNV